MTQSKYFGPIKYLLPPIVILLVAGQLFDASRDDLLSESARNSVFWQALPFVSIFISIILGFILLIFMVALRFNGKIPARTHKSIEWLAMVGILAGVFSLFQPFWRISYEYGFMLLLGSTIWFTLWSHITPTSAKTEENMPPLSSTNHLVGAGLGLIVVVVMTVLIANGTKPEVPYTMTQRRWDRTDAETQQQIADQAKSDYRNQEIPYIIFLSLFPAGLLYLVTRELVGSGSLESTPEPARASLAPKL